MWSKVNIHSHWLCDLDEIKIIFWSCSFPARRAAENNYSETVAPSGGHFGKGTISINQNRKMWSLICLTKPSTLGIVSNQLCVQPAISLTNGVDYFVIRFRLWRQNYNNVVIGWVWVSLSFPESWAFPLSLTVSGRLLLLFSHLPLNIMEKTFIPR